jgi:hypothetical protein
LCEQRFAQSLGFVPAAAGVAPARLKPARTLEGEHLAEDRRTPASNA